MTFTIIAISFLLIGIGFLGCFIHKFPGPVTAFLGMLLFIFASGCIPSRDYPWLGIAICAVLLVLTHIANKKWIPKIVEEISEIGKPGKWGCIVGSIIGLCIMLGFHSAKTGVLIAMGIVGLVIIPFGLALLFEFMSRKNFQAAVRPAAAAFSAYFLSMILKLIVCVYALIIIIDNMANG